MTKRLLTTLFVAILAAAALAGPTIAILDFEAVGCPAELARGAAELLRASLSEHEELALVERARLAEVMSEQALALSGVVDADTAVEVGGLLGADYLLVGGVTLLGGRYTIAARFVDAASGEVVIGVQDDAQVERRIPYVCRDLAEEVAEAAGALPVETPTEETPYLIGLDLDGTVIFHLAGDIHALDLASGVGRQLTFDGLSWQSAITPDGRRIAFSSKRGGDLDLYLMDPDGDDQVTLLDTPHIEDAPCWSPDGRRVAFHTERDGNWEIYSIAADGSGLTRLTDHGAEDSYPSWSPDGERIAFMTRRGAYTGGYEVYVMNADGSDPRRVAAGMYPSWSPDGESLAYVHDHDGDGGFDLYLTGLDDDDARRLTDDGGAKRFPRFTADGRTILFDDAHIDIFAYSLDTDDVYRVTWNGCVVPSYGETR